jgi:short-subunit dehydrogenase
VAPIRPVAVVTGGSSGIGLALARVLAREGYDLLLVARREQELRAIAKDLSHRFGSTSVVAGVDLSEPGAAARVHEAAHEAGLTVDVLVNNAGFGGHGRFVETDADHERQMLAVNVVALTELTKLFLPAMVQRRSGRILNVASTAAFQPGPFMAVYYASKAYVLSFTEALGEELVGTGVTATALCPGFVPSGFQDVAGLDEDLPFMRSPGTKTAEEVAEAGYRAMMSGRRVFIPGGLNRVGAHAARIAPRRAVLTMVRRIHPPDKTAG